ncbi:hypothetical protein [Paenibacillus macquariensis]|uniref:Uncharacterized protein n=1 Tax=Paenibacillus macquariensis TaxID=948756 RepID=A0ABY1KDU0_9BACL|nr:hypothetical protein [Paenibacillus macquariensis]MEC0093822.1 hypothetical protein [Paenibacillus macquariensis]OAB33605.1 hypothetical protein PMSM_13330 [Paenibacillus macquariensis subsp. macquariensis]SIR67477.1 hypothetical protein SAMN05421578_1319 [Paenibacillus macquariensis]
MSKAIVLFGPPSIGKSYFFRSERTQYSDDQIISIDKDVLNSTFFYPSLVKDFTQWCPTTLLWKTTSHLVKEASTPDWVQVLSNNGGRNVVFFLQGVTMGGVQEDIQVLLSLGFDVEFVLLAAEIVEILDWRIRKRATASDYIGAPPMPKASLDLISRQCYSSFAKAITSPIGINSFASKSPKDGKGTITYRAAVVSLDDIDMSEINWDDLNNDVNLYLYVNEYTQDEITFMGDTLLLGDSKSPQQELKTG